MQGEKVIVSNQITREYRKLLRYAQQSVHSINIVNVRKAFTFANIACSKTNESFREPLLMQSLHIAQIVASEIGLSTSSIVASLLYKFVEKGSLDLAELESEFDESSILITEELAKISSVDTKNLSSQAENFRKLLLTLTSDVRVILIKLADRLYVMRNLDMEDIETRNKVAHEVFELYAPLGHRLGLYSLKTELEDLSMKYRNPSMYDFITRQLQETASKRNRFIKEFISPIKAEMDSHEFDYEIKSRTKSVFSIWNKMRKKNVEFDEVYDLFAIRIILNSEGKNEKSDCWRVFSIVTSIYQPNPERMRDWISIPKSNGYESLHSTVIAPGGKWVEVQIRTRRMDEIAEKGFAAHWKYKGQKSDNFDSWLNKMREFLETADPESSTIMDAVKLNLYSKEIFVFTPKGDLKMLPKGSTVLDFAYEVHSNIGSTCVGARVNGKNVPIRHILNNGDKVEIQTSKTQRPKKDWLDFAITSKAKAKIKLALKEEVINDADRGKEILQRRLRNWKINFNDITVSKLLKYYKLKTSIDFYSKIASEKIDLSEIKTVLKSFEEAENQSPEKIGEVPLEKIIPSLVSKFEDVLVIDEKILNNVDYRLAKCCNPIFGDDIFGFVTINEGIKIHRAGCPNAMNLKKNYGYRVLRARWSGSDSTVNFLATVRLSGDNEIGILSRISDVINKDTKLNLRSINIDTKEEHFEGYITLFVKDVNHLTMLIHKLMKVKGVNNAQRVEI